ncbi:hypothetical protein DL98DRAFT_612986 [Cadophora sp. DSE1049]|nr:hypothetical protein DL98DRAFT_612986 [Cadophora sp. DSE1049]
MCDRSYSHAKNIKSTLATRSISNSYHELKEVVKRSESKLLGVGWARNLILRLPRITNLSHVPDAIRSWFQMISDYTTATGRWNNYSNDGWLTASLTLDVQTGSFLIAATATFITIVGTRFWSILSFSIHKYERPVQNTMHFAARYHLAPDSSGMGVEGRFCSQRTSLAIFRFHHCSVLRLSQQQVFPRLESLHQHTLQARSGSSPKAADSLHSKHPPMQSTTTNLELLCIPDGQRGRVGWQQIIQGIVTEGPDLLLRAVSWLDSHDHLGINAQTKDRIRFRKVVTCSVLKVNDLISASPVDGTDVHKYYLEPRGLGEASVGTTNYTYSWRDSTRFDNIGCTMAADKAVIYDPNRSLGWEPMNDLNRTDADVSIFFLNSNGMKYSQQVFDPLFYADRATSGSLRNENITFYGTTNLTSVLACTDQYQVQNPNTNTATELTSTFKTYLQGSQIGLNNAQLAALSRLGLGSYDSLKFSSVGGLSSAALHASDTAFQSLSPGLPDGQW